MVAATIGCDRHIPTDYNATVNSQRIPNLITIQRKIWHSKDTEIGLLRSSKPFAIKWANSTNNGRLQHTFSQ